MREMQQFHVGLQGTELCKALQSGRDQRAGTSKGSLLLTNKAHTQVRGAGRRGASGFPSALSKEEREGERGKAKYRLVQALKADIRLAAAVAHPGRLAGRETSFIQRVSGNS